MRITITPSGGTDRRPDRGLNVVATGGALTKVRATAGGRAMEGTMNHARTGWHSSWALAVSEDYSVAAYATGPSGIQDIKTARFHTFNPKTVFVTKTIEGYNQTCGVGMPIILYFDHPITNRSAIEKALQVTSCKPVTGSWYWDDQCGGPHLPLLPPAPLLAVAHADQLRRTPRRDAGGARRIRVTHADPVV